MSDPLWINAGHGDLVGNATITAANDQLAITGHGLDVGSAIMFDTTVGGGTILRPGVVYYVVVVVDPDNFQVGDAPGDEPIVFASDGTADVFAAAPVYSAQELRRAQSMFLMPGVSDRFGARQGVRPHSGAPVTISGTTWTVQHNVAVVYPGLTSVSGPYVVQLLSESGSFDPADGTNPRIDALDLQIQDDDEDALGFRRARVVYVAGTPAVTPVAPAATANSLRLMTAQVPAGGTPGPSIETLSPFAVGLGGILPVRDDTELPTAGRYEGMYVDRADEDALYRWSGSTWQRVAPAQQILETEETGDILGFTNTTFFAGTPSCGQTFIVPPSGQVFIEAYCLNRVNTFNTIYVSWSINAGTSSGGTEIVAPSSSTYVYRHVHENLINSGVTGWKKVTGLTPGDQVTAWVRHRVSGGNGDIYYRRITVMMQP